MRYVKIDTDGRAWHYEGPAAPASGYLPLCGGASQMPDEEPGEGMAWMPAYAVTEDGTEYEEAWERVPDKAATAAAIAARREALAQTDYVIIKTTEARLLGADDPYPQEFLERVCAERAAHRARINEMEGG